MHSGSTSVKRATASKESLNPRSVKEKNVLFLFQAIVVSWLYSYYLSRFKVTPYNESWQTASQFAIRNTIVQLPTKHSVLTHYPLSCHLEHETSWAYFFGLIDGFGLEDRKLNWDRMNNIFSNIGTFTMVPNIEEKAWRMRQNDISFWVLRLDPSYHDGIKINDKEIAPSLSRTAEGWCFPSFNGLEWQLLDSICNNSKA
jgi:hypothetical protein